MILVRSILLLIFICFSACVPASFLSVAQAADGDTLRVSWILDQRERSLPDSLRTASANEGFDNQKAFILENLVDAGYLSGKIDSVQIDENALRVQIFSSRGCRYRFDAFVIGFSDGVDAEHHGEILADYRSRIRSGNRFESGRLEQEMSDILRHWEDRGYMLVRAKVDDISADEEACEVSVNILVTPGDRLYLSGQLAPGLERNNPDYIFRASGVRTGDLITPRLLNNVRRNLDNTDLFEDVSEPGLVLRDGEYYLVHDLEERRTNSFDLLFGYIPDPAGGNTIVGTGNLHVRNAILPGSSLGLQFERLQQLVTKLDISYSVDWILGSPVGAGTQFNFIQQDSTYQVRNFSMHGYYALSSTTRVLGSLRQETTASNAGPNIPLRVFDANAFFAGAGLEYRRVNRRINPTSGIEGRFLIESGIKRITDDRAEEFTEITRMRQQELNLRLRAYVSPFTRQVIAPSLNGYLMISPEFTETDLNRFGGAKSLRGYREDQFQASRMLWGDVEYRYLLDRHSYAFVFGAYGYYERPALVFEPDRSLAAQDWLSSFGIGFSYRTPIGIMQFTYAVSPEDDLANGKVHFGLTATL